MGISNDLLLPCSVTTALCWWGSASVPIRMVPFLTKM
jgi:hypothetical protein